MKDEYTLAYDKRECKRFDIDGEILLTFCVKNESKKLQAEFQNISLVGFCVTIDEELPMQFLEDKRCFITINGVNVEAEVVRTVLREDGTVELGCKLKKEDSAFTKCVMDKQRDLLKRKAYRLGIYNPKKSE